MTVRASAAHVNGNQCRIRPMLPSRIHWVVLLQIHPPIASLEHAQPPPPLPQSSKCSQTAARTHPPILQGPTQTGARALSYLPLSFYICTISVELRVELMLAKHLLTCGHVVRHRLAHPWNAEHTQRQPTMFRQCHEKQRVGPHEKST